MKNCRNLLCVDYNITPAHVGANFCPQCGEPLGYNTKEFGDVIFPDELVNWRQYTRLMEFIQGQTVGVMPDGRIAVYYCDIQRFLDNLPCID